MVEFRPGQRFRVRNPATGDMMKILVIDRSPGCLNCETTNGPQQYVIRIMRQALLGESESVYDGTGCEFIRPFVGMASPLVFASCFERNGRSRGIL